jgi:DNA repair photolyase
MIQVHEIRSASILTPQKFGSLAGHYDFTINPYAGCAFACSYCYVPKFPNSHEVHEWGSWINVKTNAPQLIRKERAKIFGSRIFFSSATDPYQYIELKYRITRSCLKEMLHYPPKRLTMHSRSHLMLQDLDLLKSFGNKLSVGISLPTDSESVRQEFEPNAPSIKRRLELIRKLAENQIAVYISMAPLLPCDPERLINLVAPYTTKVWVDTMNWLEVMRKPVLLDKYKNFFHEERYERLAEEISSRFERRREWNEQKLSNEPPLPPPRQLQLSLK